jgi:hypothetical protein
VDAFRRIAEARIERAIAAGEFDDLPGAGRPLDLDSLRGVPADERAAYAVMRNAGVVPEEVTTRRQLAALDAEIAAGAPGADLATLRSRRMALELKRNLAAERRLRR